MLSVGVKGGKTGPVRAGKARGEAVLSVPERRGENNRSRPDLNE